MSEKAYDRRRDKRKIHQKNLSTIINHQVSKIAMAYYIL